MPRGSTAQELIPKGFTTRHELGPRLCAGIQAPPGLVAVPASIDRTGRVRTVSAACLGPRGMRSSINARTHKKLLVPLDLNHCTTAIFCWPVSAGRWPLADLAIHGSAVSMSYSAVPHRTVKLALGRLVSDLVQNSSALHASRLSSLQPGPRLRIWVYLRPLPLPSIYLPRGGGARDPLD